MTGRDLHPSRVVGTYNGIMTTHRPPAPGSSALFRLVAVTLIVVFGLLRADSGMARPLLPGANCVVRPLPRALRGTGGEGLDRVAPIPIPTLPALAREFAPRVSRAPAGMAIPVILMDFTTRPATMSRADVAAREFGLGSAPSVRQYYREVSSNQFELGGDVFDWVHSARSRVYYSTEYGFNVDSSAHGTPYDANVWGAIHEAVALADPHVDFSRYDSDHDGVVDAAIFVFAGAGAEETGSPIDFWSHKFDLRQSYGSYAPATPGVGLMTDDGVAIGPYVVVPDVGEIGVWCHEFGHILGLPDIYYTHSTTEGEAYADPMGFFDIMDYGEWLSAPTANPEDAVPGSLPCDMSAWCKYTLGWLGGSTDSSATASDSAFDVTLPPIETHPAGTPGAVRLLANPGGADWTPNGLGNGRYFLIENRQNIGFDRGLFQPIPAFGEAGWPSLASRADIGGLLVTFVDESVATDGDRDPAHPLLYVVGASGAPDSGGTLPGLGDSLELWPRRGLAASDEFSAATSPPHGIYDAELAEVSVTGISYTGNGSYRMHVATPGSAPLWAAAGLPSAGTGVAFAYPNPWRGSGNALYIRFVSRSGATSPLRARIVTVTGRVVRTLDSASEVNPASSQAVWDLKDDAGRPVASGLYFYVIEAGGERATGKIAVMR